MFDDFPMENPPLISVIIAAKDRPLALHNCLETWKMQDYPHIEYIVVDDSSKDPVAVKDVVDKADMGIRYFAMVGGPDRPPAKAWNLGMKEANGQFFVVTGEDLILGSKDVLRNMFIQYHGIRRISVITYWMSPEITAAVMENPEFLWEPHKISEMFGFWDYMNNKMITKASIHTYLTGQSKHEWEWFGGFINEDYHLASDTDVVEREGFLKRGCDTVEGVCCYHQHHPFADVKIGGPDVRYTTERQARLLDPRV